MSDKRKDNRGRTLEKGEYFDSKNSRYLYRKMINGERVTVLEALSQAGDLKDDASRVITVLREQNGKRELATVDLRSKDLFSSPFYYLQQNDVIYVTRSSHRYNMLRGDTSQWWSLGIGGIGFIIGIIALCAA